MSYDIHWKSVCCINVSIPCFILLCSLLQKQVCYNFMCSMCDQFDPPFNRHEQACCNYVRRSLKWLVRSAGSRRFTEALRRDSIKSGKNRQTFVKIAKITTKTASNHRPKDHYTVYKSQHLALSTIITCVTRFSSVKFCHCGALTNSRKR